MPPETITAGREIEVSEPSGIVKRKRVGNSQLDRAARELGMISLSSRGMKNFGVVGRFLDQVGIIDYGNGKLIATSEALDEGIKKCAALAANVTMTVELRATFLELQLRFIKAQSGNVQQMAELNEAKQSGDVPRPMPTKPFLPGAQISPINLQVNVGGQPVTVTEKKVEASP